MYLNSFSSHLTISLGDGNRASVGLSIPILEVKIYTHLVLVHPHTHWIIGIFVLVSILS